MRKLILFFAIIPVLTFSQTTIEEWNYCTKGYEIQLESGLDMKKGYFISRTISIYNPQLKSGLLRFSFNELIRQKDNSVAAILVHMEVNIDYCGTRLSKDKYICIPTGNYDYKVSALFEQQTSDLGYLPIYEHFINSIGWYIKAKTSKAQS